MNIKKTYHVENTFFAGVAIMEMKNTLPCTITLFGFSADYVEVEIIAPAAYWIKIERILALFV